MAPRRIFVLLVKLGGISNGREATELNAICRRENEPAGSKQK